MSAMILCDALVASMRERAGDDLDPSRNTQLCRAALAADATAQALEQTLPGRVHASS